jgi:predicted TPR repeat methyltransferase
LPDSEPQARPEELAAAGRLADAAAAYRALIAAGRDGGRHRADLAELLRRLGQVEEAASQAREAVLLAPSDPESLAIAGLVFLGLDAPNEAAAALYRALRLHPERRELQFHLGRAYAALSEPERAAAAFRRYLASGEDNLGAAAAIAALAGGNELNATYVRALFDQYAADFDRNLVEDLGYIAPAALRLAIERALARRGRQRLDSALDLGCGTGLGGAAVRSLVSTLAGVDLSPRMIERARARGIYDRLEVGDLCDALVAAAPASVDLVLAADSFAYIGALEPIFAAAARALEPDGLFAATFEADEGGRFTLSPKRRYRHSRGYLTETANRVGLSIHELSEGVFRREGKAPVSGLLLVAAAG